MKAEAWAVDAVEHRFGEHLGRLALFIDGGVATALGVEAQDGVVEVDVALERKRGFHGLVWRASAPATTSRSSSGRTSPAIRMPPSTRPCSTA
jgi:hypothetical protein